MRIRHSIALGPLFVLSSLGTYGQSPEVPQFEAADIRVNPSGDPPAAQYLPGGQMTLHSMTMKLLIGLACRHAHRYRAADASKTAGGPVPPDCPSRAKDGQGIRHDGRQGRTEAQSGPVRRPGLHSEHWQRQRLSSRLSQHDNGAACQTVAQLRTPVFRRKAGRRRHQSSR